MACANHSFLTTVNLDDAPFWSELYRQIWPGYTHHVVETRKREQERGIDHYVYVDDNEPILIDVKVRFEAHADVLLEFLSNDIRNKPGWAAKELDANFVLYATVVPSEGTTKCVAWLMWHKDVREALPRFLDRRVYRVRNDGYCSLNVAVYPWELEDAGVHIETYEFDPPIEGLLWHVKKRKALPFANWLVLDWETIRSTKTFRSARMQAIQRKVQEQCESLRNATT